MDVPTPSRNDAAALSNEGSGSVMITCEHTSRRNVNVNWKAWWVQCCVLKKMSRRNQKKSASGRNQPAKAELKASRAKCKNFEIYHIIFAVIVSNFLNRNFFFESLDVNERVPSSSQSRGIEVSMETDKSARGLLKKSATEASNARLFLDIFKM